MGQALVAGLAARGVEVVFGIPGVHTIELYRGLAGSGIRHVTPRHEQGAGFMADGYARVSGRPGVAFVITGPGVTNILTAMAQARAESVPMLVVSSVNARATLGRGLGHLHELPDQRALMAQVALHSERIEDAAGVGPALDRAFAAMLSGRPGPVHIEVPLDVMPLPALPLPALAAADPAPARPAPHPDEAALDKAAALLGAARDCVILAGGGARRAGAELARLARALDAPVVQTVNARGLMAGDALAVPASPSLRAVRALIGAAGRVLAVGTEIGPTDYDMYAHGGLPDLSGMIRIDIDAAQLARHPAALTLQGDAAAVLGALADRVAARPAGPGAADAAGAGATEGAARARAALGAALDEVGPRVRAQIDMVGAIRDALPGCIIAGDSTAPVYAGNLVHAHDRPGGWFNAATGYGALGYGPGAAIGAAIAAAIASGSAAGGAAGAASAIAAGGAAGGAAGPAAGGAAPRGTRVVCLIGDGGLQFSPGELMTAADEGLPVTFVVWNNRGFDEIALAMAEAGAPVIGCDPRPPRFDRLAEACGLPFASVPATPAALAEALHRVTEGPAMVEIVVPAR